MTPEQLNEIEARASAATQGPWEARINDLTNEVTVEHDTESRFMVAWVSDDHKREWALPDAEFIATARTDVPALVAEVRRMQKAINLHRRIRRWGNDDYSITEATYQLALKHDPEEVADMTPFTVCEECYEVEDTIRQENGGDTLLGIRSHWPCPTIQALGGAGE